MGPGRPPVFEALYARHGDRIYRLCCRLCGNSADAEDLTQEVFLRAFRDLHQFEGRASLAAWLYRIAMNQWKNSQRTCRLETVPLEEAMETALPDDPEAARLDQISLESALASLSEPVREAFILVRAEGLKYREAAAVLDIPLGLLKSRIHEATVQLRSLLTEEIVDERIRFPVLGAKAEPGRC